MAGAVQAGEEVASHLVIEAKELDATEARPVLGGDDDIAGGRAAAAETHADGATAVDERVVAHDVVRRLQGQDLILAAAAFEEVVFNDRERAAPGRPQIIAAGAQGLMPVFTPGVDDIAEMIVIDTVML